MEPDLDFSPPLFAGATCNDLQFFSSQEPGLLISETPKLALLVRVKQNLNARVQGRKNEIALQPIAQIASDAQISSIGADREHAAPALFKQSREFFIGGNDGYKGDDSAVAADDLQMGRDELHQMMAEREKLWMYKRQSTIF